ncbi:MAG TPA: ATP-binding protein [Fimbriimonadales bacterium]|nr:ATP-binding protein [Fimbriimonadales bacterium]
MNRVQKSLLFKEEIWELFQLEPFDSTNDQPYSLRKVVEFCSRWFEADSVSLFLRIDGCDTFVLSAQAGEHSALPETATFVLGAGIAGKAAEESKPLLFDGSQDSEFLIKGSAIVVPLLTMQNECIGVINMSRNENHSPFSKEDLKKVIALSRYLALAISNARLVAALHAAKEQYRAVANKSSTLIEALHAGIIVIDSLQIVIEANSRALHMLRRTPESFIGEIWENVLQRFTSDTREAINHCYEEALSGRSTSTTGSTIFGEHFRVSAIPGSQNRVTFVFQDITEQIEREREFERAQRFVEIGQMSAAIAHEFRNPLTSISGAAQLIKASADLSEIRQWADVILHESADLNHLCDDFLDFAKPLALKLRAIDVNELMQNIVSYFSKECPEGITLRFVPSPKSPHVLADRLRFTHAIRNLLQNGIQAMPNGGRLRVGVGVRDDWVLITVSDQGIGIPYENMNRIFIPFFTTKADGTGLGLANVRRVIEAHGGRVEVVSKPGVGTRFLLKLPTRKSE